MNEMYETRKCHTEWGNPTTKEHTWYALIDKWILAQKLGIPKIKFTDQRKFKKTEDHNMDSLVLLRRGNKILMGGETKTKYGAKTKGKTIQRLPYLGFHPIQSPKPDTVLDTNKGLLTGAWFGCLLRGPAYTWQIQRWVLSANHWTELNVPSGGARDRTKRAEGDCNPIGKTTIWTNQ